MPNDGAQLQLPREPIALDESMVSRPKNLLRAFVMSADLGGLDDKQAAAAAGMDASTWSLFKNGERGIKPMELDGFMGQCGNHLVLAYWAYINGYNLVHRESELERLLRVERERADGLKRENEMLNGLLRGLVSGKAP